MNVSVKQNPLKITDRNTNLITTKSALVTKNVVTSDKNYTVFLVKTPLLILPLYKKPIGYLLQPMKTLLPEKAEEEKCDCNTNPNLNDDVHNNTKKHLDDFTNVSDIDSEFNVQSVDSVATAKLGVDVESISVNTDIDYNNTNKLEQKNYKLINEHIRTEANKEWKDNCEGKEAITEKQDNSFIHISNVQDIDTRNINTLQNKFIYPVDIQNPLIKSIGGNNCSEELRTEIDLTTITTKKEKIIDLSERAKKTSWYNVFYPNYKSRSQNFKKLFKEIPTDERLIVDYSCALFKDLLLQGRLYVSENYVCFHANILGWETHLIIKWDDVKSVTKEKTALVIPNAISIATAKENYFFSSFTTRDKTYLALFRIWRNTLMRKSMMPHELWQLVHNYYGDELGLTTDDEDYVDPSKIKICHDSNGTTWNHLNDTITTTIAETRTSTNALYSSTFTVAITPSTSFSTICEPKLSISVNKAESSEHSQSNTNNNSCSDRGNYKQSMKSTTTKHFTTLTSSSVPPVRTSDGSCDSGGGGTRIVSDNDGSKESKHYLRTHESSKHRKLFKYTRLRDDSACKSSEVIPTDMSDSSDSEENNVPFVATVECNSTHEGRQLVHTILPINIEILFNLLFSKSKFLVDFHTLRKSTDMIFGEWIINEAGQKSRTVNVTVQLSASVGPKTSKVTEYQLIRDCSKPGELYSIDINSVNAGIPYADSFTVLMHYCLVKTVDDHTMLSVHAQIKYTKSIWGVVKGFIEKNTWAGLEDFYTALLNSLQNETNIPPAKGKGRRPRRGNVTTQNRSLEDLPLLQMKNDVPEHLHSSHTLASQIKNDLPEHLHSSHILATQMKNDVPEHLHSSHTLASHLASDVPLTIVTETPNKYKWLCVFLLMLLCFLIIVSIVLLFKLWRLEDHITYDMENRARLPTLLLLKQLPSTTEGWLELMREQEIFHENELKKWHYVLETAIDLLKKVSVVCENILNENNNSYNITQRIGKLKTEL